MKKTDLDYWKLLDDISVVDAAILISGNNPSVKEPVYVGGTLGEIDLNPDGSKRYHQKTDYENFDPAFKVLRNAIFNNKLKANLAFSSRQEFCYQSKYYIMGEPYYTSIQFEDSEQELKVPFDILLRAQNYRCKYLANFDIRLLHDATTLWAVKEPNWNETTVDVDDLKVWLESRGFYPEFFFPNGAVESYKSQEHPRYSPKLACAVAAWEAVENRQPNKSVKESVAAWVQSNGVRFGVANADGLVPAKAMEQIATVVNWATKGGATPTYTSDAEGDGAGDAEVQNFESYYTPEDDSESTF